MRPGATSSPRLPTTRGEGPGRNRPQRADWSGEFMNHLIKLTRLGQAPKEQRRVFVAAEHILQLTPASDSNRCTLLLSNGREMNVDESCEQIAEAMTKAPQSGR